MKKLFTLALIFTAMMLCSAVHAQTGTAVKPAEPAANPAPAAQDTTKKDTKQPPAASQSDNKKEEPAAPASGSGAPGGTRMAINEQGVPTKKTAKPKSANANTTTSDPAAEPEKKKSEK